MDDIMFNGVYYSKFPHEPMNFPLTLISGIVMDVFMQGEYFQNKLKEDSSPLQYFSF